MSGSSSRDTRPEKEHGEATQGMAAFKKDEQSKIITKMRATLRAAQKMRDAIKLTKKVRKNRIEKQKQMKWK